MGTSSSYQGDMNSTSNSLSCDKNGDYRWASFEYYNYKHGKNRIVYKGISFKSNFIRKDEDENEKEKQNGKTMDNINNTYWTKMKCVVKSAKRTEFEKNDKRNETYQWFKRLSLTGSDYAHMFGKDYPSAYRNSKITFAKSYLAEIDNMSSLWNTCCHFCIIYKKRMWEDDLVLIEEWIDGIFENFISEDGTPCDAFPDILEAFVHYSYQKSEGKIVICGLQGAVDTNWIYHLTVPTIHSMDQSFGPKDKGVVGIKEVFANHQCGNLCQKDWIKPQSI